MFWVLIEICRDAVGFENSGAVQFFDWECTWDFETMRESRLDDALSIPEPQDGDSDIIC